MARQGRTCSYVMRSWDWASGFPRPGVWSGGKATSLMRWELPAAGVPRPPLPWAVLTKSEQINAKSPML